MTRPGSGGDGSSSDVARALSELSSLVIDRNDIHSTLERIAVVAERAVPNADAVAASLVKDGKIVTEVTTRDMVKSLDSEQYRLDQGPCLQSMEDNEIYQIDDANTDERWPLFCRRAAAAGVRSLLSFPLEVGGEVVGALNLYAFEPDTFDASATETGTMLAAQAAVALRNAAVYERSRVLIGQLKQALESRTVIERARGLLMGQMGVTSEDAMRMLRSRSQRLNTKLRQVALEILRRTREDDGPDKGVLGS